MALCEVICVTDVSGKLEHSVDWAQRFFGQRGVDAHFGSAVAQTVAQLCEGVELHVCAVVAGTCAVGRRYGNEILFRCFLAHLVENAGFGCDDEILGLTLERVSQ